MRFIAAPFSVISLLGTPAFGPAARNRPAPPILPDTIVQWTRLLTAGIIPRYVLSRPIQVDVPCPVGKEVKAAELDKGRNW